MDFLITLNHKKTVHDTSEKYIWNYIDSKNDFYTLEWNFGNYFIKGTKIPFEKLYLYCNKTKIYKKININNDEKLSVIKDDLVKMNDIFIENTKWKREVAHYIKNITFYTKYISGWDISNSKIKLKITLDNFKSITEKSIRLQSSINDKSQDIFVTGKQVLTFVKKHKDNIFIQQEPKSPNTILNVTKQIKDLKLEDENQTLNKNHQNNLIHHIKLTKARRIAYQSCIPYDENKKRLEQIMGVELNLH
jgi:hypothetical protein